MQGIYHDEFKRNQKIFDEIDFADEESLKQIYLDLLNKDLTYKVEADEFQIELFNETHANPKKLKKQRQRVTLM